MPATRGEPSLADVWRRSARRASDTQLAICAAVLPVTVAASIVVAVVRPRWTIEWWPLTAVPFLVAAFGLWGIGDRELSAPEAGAAPAKWGWRLVQTLAAAVAGLSAAVIVVWFLSRVVGTWIS